MQKVQAGELRIPRFQRPLRWTREDVIELFDSIWRGYPIGSLLFWKRKAEAGPVKVGGATLDAPAVADAWWVVDGQQRITALAASLLELDHAGDHRWRPSFDATNEVFLPWPVPPGLSGCQVPVSVLGDLRRLGRWLRENNPAEKEASRLEEAQQRLLDYSIPAYIVETEDEHALRGVFARLNSSGSRMRADEVFQALLGAPSMAGAGSPDLHRLQAACDLDGFGVPPRAEVLKAVLAIAGHDPTRRLEDLGSLIESDLPGLDTAQEALTRTIQFLREDCRIPHYSLIPYPVVFVILARWFHVHPDHQGSLRELLARWVWRGAASGAHQRAEVSRMREQIRTIDSDGRAEEAIERLLARVGPQPSGSWRLSRFNLKSARSRIEVLALLDQAPQDPLGPVDVRELITDGRVAREVFRSSERKSLPEGVVDLARTAANRVLLASRHSGLSAELRSWQWELHREAFQSHLIDQQAMESLRSQDAPAFLRRRAVQVEAAVDAFIGKRAAWDEPELLPLEAYLEMA